MVGVCNRQSPQICADSAALEARIALTFGRRKKGNRKEQYNENGRRNGGSRHWQNQRRTRSFARGSSAPPRARWTNWAQPSRRLHRRCARGEQRDRSFGAVAGKPPDSIGVGKRRSAKRGSILSVEIGLRFAGRIDYDNFIFSALRWWDIGAAQTLG